MTIRIVTDSTCDLPAEVIARLDIRVMPLYIRVGSHDYLDGIDMRRDEFYEKLPQFSDYPTTAVPSGHKFRAIYDSLADEGASEVFSIHISSSLSGTVDVARAAAAETSSLAVHVIDSRQLSMGTGFLVQTAAEMARAGCSAAEIHAALESQTRRTYVAALLDTLTYLRRSGRMNRVVSTIGEILQIKPILKMANGISEAEKIRTRKKGIERLVAMLTALSPFEKIAFLHSGALEEAKLLMEKVRQLLPDQEIGFEIINPVLGSHIGTGVIGFACVKKE